MARGQYFLLIIIVLTVVITLISREKIYQNLYDVEINGKPAPHSLKSIKEENSEIYITASYLSENGGLKIALNDSKNKITLYRENLQVTFNIGEKKDDAFEESGKYFIPLKKLIERFGGKYVWDKENKILSINLY